MKTSFQQLRHKLKQKNRMEKVILIFAAASALSAGSSLPVRTFHFVEERKTWTEAQSFCRENYKDLVTIEDMEDMMTINNMLALNSVQAWIGFYDDVNSWRWSMSDSNLYAQGERPFRNWASREPDNYQGEESCGEIISNGLWRDVQCSQTMKFVCFEGTNATLVLINTFMNWTQAQSYCREHYTDLVSIRNQAENQKVVNLIPTSQRAWIGFFRDTWKWSDGSSSSFSFWTGVEPDNLNNMEACGATDPSVAGGWEDLNCASKYLSICYNIPVLKHVVKLKQVKPSSLVLEDPAVQENLLTQLNQKLKDRGMNRNIILSWRKQPDGNIFHLEPIEEMLSEKDLP